MKLLTLAAVAAALLTAGVAQAGTLEVTVTGVQPKGGRILTALQTREQFMKPMAVAGRMLPGDSAGVVTFTLADIPAGDYALSVLHDADGNNTMTLGSDGRPAEGWGMAGAENLHAKPTFDQVSTHISAGADVTRITIPMIYPAG